MQTCPSCGEENPDQAKFCSNCAAPLTAVDQPTAEERKQVTVLFCDLVGFTASSDQADPEDVRARLKPFHSMLRGEIEGFGGTVEKFIGDAVMAVFGAPVAHEDDPERAIRAGLRILEAIDELNDRTPGLDLAVRIGINTGEAVVALGARPEQGEGMVTGDVVNTASRLQGVAPTGGIVVGEGTYRATERIFDYRELDPVTVKGKAAPVAIWQALAARSRFGTDLIRSLDTPLVGRDLERDLLTSTLERAARDQAVHLVTIVGEPGVGKSRLVAELFSYIDSPTDLISWRQGRCLPYGEGITFWALGEIVKAQAGILETDSPESAGDKLNRMVADDDPDAVWLRARLRPLVGLEAPQAAREENFAAWRRLLESIAEVDPAVYVFEDLHWADQALLEFLEHLADYAEGVPMLVVGTARPELYERAPGFAQTARNATRINLGPLSEQDTARLVGNLLEQAVLPAEVQQTVLDRSGGNPFYAEEFVRLLKDRGILTKTGATWTLDPDAEVPMPSEVQGLIAARLDTLSPNRKRMLADAAVIGKVFWSGAVAHMGDRDRADVERALHELSRKELIRPARRSSVEGQAEYAFWHALIRDVCYSQIPRAHRAELHVQAAAWIEQMAGDRLEDHAEILASHTLTALDLATATNMTEVDDLLSRAVRYLMLAGDRAMGMDLEAAERHYARALELTPGDHLERAQLLARHAEALQQRGRFREASRAYQEAIEGFHARGDVRGMAVAMGHRGIVMAFLGEPGYRELSAEALSMLEPLGPSPELARALTEEAATYVVSGDPQVGLGLADRAIALTGELGLPEPARALGFRGAARAFIGDSGGLEDMRHALELANAQGLGREVAVLYNNLSEALGSIEGPRARLEANREGGTYAERRGIVEFVLTLTANTAEALVDLGAYDEATALADDLVPRLLAAEDMYDLVLIRSQQMLILIRRGRPEGAVPLGEWGIANAKEIGDAQIIAQILSPMASAYVALGDRRAAIAALSELDRSGRDYRNFVRTLPDNIRAALAVDDSEAAARLIEGVEPIYPLHKHALVTARALLAEHRAEYAQAAEAFADAASRWEQFEMPWEQAQALLGRGRCLLPLGAANQAARSLQAAREIFVSLQATPALADTDGLLKRATALTS